MHANPAVPDSFVLGPQREVVSIYNDDFTTPADRKPYFISVTRCVKVEQGDTDDGKCSAGNPNLMYPVQGSHTRIEILVPDIRNDNRYYNPKKFYKYVVYNHTSCICGKLKDRKLYGNITNNEG